jgi:hypothetical protein
MRTGILAMTRLTRHRYGLVVLVAATAVAGLVLLGPRAALAAVAAGHLDHGRAESGVRTRGRPGLLLGHRRAR